MPLNEITINYRICLVVVWLVVVSAWSWYGW